MQDQLQATTVTVIVTLNDTAAQILMHNMCAGTAQEQDPQLLPAARCLPLGGWGSTCELILYVIRTHMYTNTRARAPQCQLLDAHRAEFGLDHLFKFTRQMQVHLSLPVLVLSPLPCVHSKNKETSSECIYAIYYTHTHTQTLKLLSI